MINIPTKQSTKIPSRAFLKREPSTLDIHKMKGAHFSGKGVKRGSVTSTKKGGVTGRLRDEINKGGAFGSTRKSKYQNLSNDDIKTMSGLIYDEMKKNERPGLTAYQKNKILQKGTKLTADKRKDFSKSDLKDFREIVTKIEQQTYGIGKSNPKTTPKSTIPKKSNSIKNNFRLNQPVALKRNKFPNTTENDEPTEKDKPTPKKNLLDNIATASTPLKKPSLEKPENTSMPIDMPID
jgi:hypothetical protein